MDRRKRRPITCSENEELANFLWTKREELAQSPKGLSDNLDTTLYNAYCNVCACKNPIKTIKQFSEVKGIGKWTLKQSQGFFDTGSGVSEDEDAAKKGKRSKSTRRYVPQKNSVAYALLITLYRAVGNGAEFMRKQELIDAAEASGLSRVSIGPEKGKGKPKDFGSSPRDWYSGWNCMKTLVTKGLVAKSSCPAKYMLTEEGKEVARNCISRSGLIVADEISAPNDQSSNLKQQDLPDPRQSGKDLLESEFPSPSLKKVHPVCVQYTKQKKSVELPSEFLNKFLQMGFCKEEVNRVSLEVSETSQGKDIASLWPTVLCRLRENQVYGKEDILATKNPQRDAVGVVCSDNSKSSGLNSFNQELPTLGPRPTTGICNTKLDDFGKNSGLEVSSIKPYNLAVPPLDVGERFEEAYKVILILDDREYFARGSRSSKIIDNISIQFQIEVEVRRLPIGDGIWIAQHKQFGSEYVLDFIVERKRVDDLRSSIRDNRYKDQKLRLLRCGLKKMIYLVEGDPNASEAAESIKTACFTTEILEGFDVQRTTGLGDTLRKYGHLTQSIKKYYRSLDHEPKSSVCTSYNDFVKRCQEMEKLTVSDVFAIQLMQVPQVTEDVAIAVVDLYPTLVSLARAYSLLDGDTRAQEEMLKKQSNNLINGTASRNIFQLVWGT